MSKKSVVLFLFSLLFLSGTVYSYNWVIETVDTLGDVGQFSSLALDSFGNPHICYYCEQGKDLKYAFSDGTSWHYGTVDTAGDVGTFCDIVIGSDNHLHISYYDQSNMELKHAYFDGIHWLIGVADPALNVGQYTSIAFDSTDAPYISFYSSSSGALKLTCQQPGGNWIQSTVDNAGDVGKYTSIAIGTDNLPRITYLYDDGEDSRMKFARFNGSSWDKEYPDPAQGVGRYTSLVLDNTNDPYISYYDFENGRLKYAKKIGASWTRDIVDNVGNVGEYSSVVLDNTGKPVISYYDRGNRDLRFAHYTGTVWETDIVDSSGNVGKFTSCKVRVGNTIYISYYDETNKNLKIAMTYGDTIAPGPPENLMANDSNPSPWTNNPKFEIDWTNPVDSSGIMRSLYKLETAPTSNYDTTGSMSGIPSDSASATIESGQMLYLWLEDEASYVDYQNNAAVELRYDGTAPTESDASSPLYSTSPGFAVNWTSGSDAGGSGLSGTYDVKVKNGAGPWIDWLINYADLSATYPGTDGHTYYFEAGARDDAGNIETFTGVPECSTIVDMEKPSVISVYPADGDTGIVMNTQISAMFSELMDSTTMIAANFLVSGSTSGNHTFATNYDSVDSAVCLDLDVDFAANETVTVTVKKEVADLAGNTMQNDEIWLFSVGAIIDTLGPITSSANVVPNPTEPIACLAITASVSDIGREDNLISAAEFFVDVPGPNGTGYHMNPLDSVWDEINEDVIRAFDNESFGWSIDDTHSVFIHGKDAPGNWGDFDTVQIIVVPDDDTLGPTFSNFGPAQWSDTLDFYVECRITDPSWVYDDSTGSDGQGVYLLWDNDGEIVIDANEVTMWNTTGVNYMTDSLVPVQTARADFVFEVYAYDNDFDTEHPSDRTQGSSELQSVTILDVRGPNTTNLLASPNPTAGAIQLVVAALVSDSLLGNSIISGAEYFVNAPGPDGTGTPMEGADGLFDETAEQVTDTFDISSWQYDTSRWVYVHGVDASGNWGNLDSILVSVSEPIDVISPWVAYTSPDVGETDVAFDIWIYATFTEKMNPSTVTHDKILVEGSVGGVYDSWMSYNEFDSTLSIRSLDDFAPFESVNVHIASGIQDLAGNYMSTEYWWWFKTGKGPDTLSPVVEAIDINPKAVMQGDSVLLIGTISDDKRVADAECFIDLTGANGTGHSVIPTDSFGIPSIDVFFTVYTDTLSLGTHTIHLHGVDASANWGDYDSVWFYIGEEDTTSPIFDIGIRSSPVSIGDTVQITAIPNELLHPDSAVVCSVSIADGMTYTLTLLPDSATYFGTLSTVGFVSGHYVVKVYGYDIWSNNGFSSASFGVDPGGEFLPEHMVYAWPNPARGDKIYFHFYVNANADVTVHVFNLEGKGVATLHSEGDGGRSPHQQSSNAIVWDISHIASDVYIFRLYAVSHVTGEKAYVVKKFAVVR